MNFVRIDLPSESGEPGFGGEQVPRNRQRRFALTAPDVVLHIRS